MSDIASRPIASIHHQVRAFAGSFVLVGLALGWWVHPAFFLFTAFVGLNLLQSAFTGFCPLETLLRRAAERRAAPPPRRQAA